MVFAPPSIAGTVEAIHTNVGTLTVTLSNELVHLLSDQLYQSPSKAIEEMVVNAYDADAKECKVFVPSPSSPYDPFIVIFDDGTGMDYEGLVELWYVGRSPKINDRSSKQLRRKQIGKFGIGKLATYAIATKLTLLLEPTMKFSLFRSTTVASLQA